MPTYQVFAGAVTEAKEYTLGGGTEAEWLAHVAEEPTNPSAVVKYASALKATAKFRVSLKIAGTPLNTGLEAGEKVTAITYHFNLKGGAEAKTVRVGAVLPEDKSEPTVKVAQTWFSVAATEAHAKELTKAKLEELRLFCENLLAKEILIYEIYATVTTEAAGGAIVGKAQGPLILDGKATGTAVQVVSGKATGPLLLTGTSTGTAAQRVSGKATGPLLLTGTSKGTAVQVVQGKAAGTLILTGSATTKGGEAVVGKASGALLLLGSAKGTPVQVVAGKATGTVLLTGTATGTAAQQVIGRATGVLRLTGRATAAGGAVTKRNVIFIFED